MARDIVQFVPFRELMRKGGPNGCVVWLCQLHLHVHTDLIVHIYCKVKCYCISSWHYYEQAVHLWSAIWVVQIAVKTNGQCIFLSYI